MHRCWQIGPLLVRCLLYDLQHAYPRWCMQVITKQVDGHKYEPFEEAVIEVPEEHVGPVVDMLGQRKGQMMDLVAGTDTTSLTRYIPVDCPILSRWLACILSPSLVARVLTLISCQHTSTLSMCSIVSWYCFR